VAFAWDVDFELVEAWLLELDQRSYEQVVAAVELLGEIGPQLGRLFVDTAVGSRHKDMKELRPGSSGRSELEEVVPRQHPDRRQQI
jgi:hypothetical protein